VAKRKVAAHRVQSDALDIRAQAKLLVVIHRVQ
jgi:hypothetical protein